MYEQEKFDKLVEKYPHPHIHFSRRPDFSRRRFFQLAGAGVTASFLAERLPAAPSIIQYPVTMKNTAKNVIFILLAGAPSHTDLFDYKVIPGTTPTSFNPTTVNGILWPAGLL